MAARLAAEILGLGAVTPVGLTAGATAAAVRAGITRLRESSIHDKYVAPLVTGFLDEAEVPPLLAVLAAPLEAATERHRRMVRLAAPALQEAARGLTHRVPLLLALPEAPPWGDPVHEGFLGHLVEQSGVALDVKQSQVLRLGRAGSLVAVERALELLATRRVPTLLVGGVDTYRDARLLAMLDAEGRLHNGPLPDGLIPGEGAAFLLLGRPGEGQRQGLPVLGQLLGGGSGAEPGHRYSEEPYLGEGLSQAFRSLFERVQAQSSRVRCVYTGFNGERFWTKEWGVAYLRHARHFEEGVRIEHPVESMGDLGAALGGVMVMLAATGLRKGYREGPCLVWCSSDREERAAVLVDGA
ncbi:hypothetical protein [Corallococcus llansteffanensis]|uniref:hypothetical protein n=1 Tax=Corallococcus llansteffanensis TaxID=2316731 RepID=UPI0013150EC3|nr:hypothetical protein [Corallococcus llansteffanensis]